MNDCVLVGIDLGTSTCYVECLFPNGLPFPLLDSGNDECIESCVGYTVRNGTRKVRYGKAARSQCREAVVYEMKRLIGKKYGCKDFEEDLKRWPFSVVEGANGMAEIEIVVNKEKERESPVVHVSRLLEYIRSLIVEKLDRDYLVKTVITVPHRFGTEERNATLEAATLAGFPEVELFSEPSAGALAYYTADPSQLEGKTVCVYDFGGGTFDVTIVEVKNRQFNVKASDGDLHLGGADIDSLLMAYYLEQTDGTKSANDLKPRARIKLIEKCRQCKHELSRSDTTDLSDEGTIILTRERFNNLIQPIIAKTIEVTRNCIFRWNRPVSDLDGFLLIGGSSEIPLVSTMLKEAFGRPLITKISPHTAVRDGALAYGE